MRRRIAMLFPRMRIVHGTLYISKLFGLSRRGICMESQVSPTSAGKKSTDMKDAGMAIWHSRTYMSIVMVQKWAGGGGQRGHADKIK